MWRLMARGLVLAGLVLVLSATAAHAQFIGIVETPADGETVSGMVRVRGFALSDNEISRIDLYIDDKFQHVVNINLPRIDVIEAYPNWQGIQSKRPGFETGFLASRFSSGSHTLHLVVTTANNQTFEIGRRTIVVDNRQNQPPFGHIDIPDRTAIVDANGSFPLVGWVVDTDGIQKVDVLVDGLVLQGAVYGDPRPDVGNAFPDLPAAMFSGFVAHIETTRIQDGVHTFTVRATDRLGLSRVIGQRNVQIFNSTNNLRPFGYLDEPLRDATLFGTNCAVTPPVVISPAPPINPRNHLTPVRGWALDLGTREDMGRVAYAEVLVDGVVWASTDQCSFNSTFGGLINCYGMPRFDVQKFYPTYPDAPRSGFLFMLDVGFLVASGVPPGNHNLKIRVGDKEQTFADIPNTSGIPVFFQCVESNNDFPSIGFIDFPDPMDFVKGTVVFRGWALDENLGVNAVNIYVDGQFAGVAAYGFARVDVQQAYPNFRNSFNSGWTFSFDTTQLSDGRHRLTVEVLDGFNRKAIIGSRDFFTDNFD